MDYEKKYKEAMEKFKNFKDKYCTGGDLGFGDIIFDKSGKAQEEFDNIFPELKESEDERIRKEIIRVFKGETSFTSHKENEKYIAWLEKQSEEKPESITDEWIEDYWQHKKVNNPYSYDKGEEIQFDHQGFVRFCKKYCKNPAWSEEDEEIISMLIDLVEYKEESMEAKVEFVAWLKSLKDRAE